MKPDGSARGNRDGRPSSEQRSRRLSRSVVIVIRVGLVILLALYWSSMFFGTHLTRMPRGLAGQNDKLLHLAAYMGLAVLLLSWRMSRRLVSLRSVILLWLMIAAYGVFDEVTQPLFGRNADINDWLADLAGAAMGLAIARPIASRLLSPLPAVTDAK